MACRITELVLDCRDPERLAGFWCEVLGWKVLDRDGNEAIEIGPERGADGAQPVLVLSASTDPKRDKLRLHLDVGQTGAESWHVLADPEGNEFCLLRRRVAPVG